METIDQQGNWTPCSWGFHAQVQLIPVCSFATLVSHSSIVNAFHAECVHQRKECFSVHRSFQQIPFQCQQNCQFQVGSELDPRARDLETVNLMPCTWTCRKAQGHFWKWWGCCAWYYVSNKVPLVGWGPRCPYLSFTNWSTLSLPQTSNTCIQCS